jgi:plastocyanin
MRISRWPVAASLALVPVLVLAPAAGAVHLFPLVEGDPSDCAAGLAEAPAVSDAHVGVALFSFRDANSGTNVTEVARGQTVTWTWDLPHCHSVTSREFTTYGGPPGTDSPDQPQLVKPEGDRNSFSVTFDRPGTYQYGCVHHAEVGMRGTVIVR